MNRHFLLKTVSLLLVLTMFVGIDPTFARSIELNYSGGSVSGDGGGRDTTSGYHIPYEDAWRCVVGYRFSIVDENGNKLTGSKVTNFYLDNLSRGAEAYESYERFLLFEYEDDPDGELINKLDVVKMAKDEKLKGVTGAQSNEYRASKAGFASVPDQNPSSVQDWIQYFDEQNGYKNLRRIYAACGLDFSAATDSDYVLVEPIVEASLAGVNTAANSTEGMTDGISKKNSESFGSAVSVV